MLRKFVFTHPALLAFLYALAPVSLAYLNWGGARYSWYPVYAVLISLISMAVYFGWPAAALHILKREKSDVKAIGNNKGFIFLGIFVVGLLFGWVYSLLSGTGIADPFRNVSEGLKGILSLGVIFTLFAFFWSVSSAFVDAEKEQSAGFVRRIGGFLGIFYFFVGIFFLSPRLKKILSES